MLVRSRSRNPWGVSSRRRLGDPTLYAQQYGLLLWLRADMGITLGGALRATGTAPPAVTITGAPTSQVGLHIEIDSVAGGTALGQATYKWSINNGSSYVATGVTTAAGPTALGTTGISVSFAAGPYNMDNKWDATVSAWADQSGNGNHATQATAANQPLFSVAAFGGYSALDYGVGATFGLATPSVTLGTHSFAAAIRGDASNGYIVVQNNDGTSGYLFGRSPHAGRVARGANTTDKDAAANWAADAARCTVGKTFDGTAAGHLIYKNGADIGAVPGALNADPGTSTVAGPLYVGNNQAFTTSLRGLMRELMAFSSPVPPAVMLALHRGMVARAAGAI
jgi:hypothetical protein